MDNWVIATGGGAVKRRANMEMLEKSGVLIYLFRPLELILQNQDLSDRPLLASDVEKRLGELYEERRGLYEKATISG